MDYFKTSHQLAALYALSHQELFELVKILACKTSDMCSFLQTGHHLQDEERIEQALDFAASGFEEAINEAKSNWCPVIHKDA